MATKKLYLLEYLSSEGSLLVHEGLVTVVLWGLLYVLLLIVLSFSFNVQIGELSDYQDLSVLEDILFHLGLGITSRQNSTLVVPLCVFVLLFFHEPLRGHIGEKRPDDSNRDLKNSRFRAQKTALFYSAVFCMLPVALFNMPKRRPIPLRFGQRF